MIFVGDRKLTACTRWLALLVALSICLTPALASARDKARLGCSSDPGDSCVDTGVAGTRIERGKKVGVNPIISGRRPASEKSAPLPKRGQIIQPTIFGSERK